MTRKHRPTQRAGSLAWLVRAVLTLTLVGGVLGMHSVNIAEPHAMGMVGVAGSTGGDMVQLSAGPLRRR